MASRRYVKAPFWAVAATSLAAAGMFLSAGTALADEKGEDSPQCMFPLSDGTCPIPGTAITRSAAQGVALAGPAQVRGIARGGTYSGDPSDDASAGAPFETQENSAGAFTPCYSGGFNFEACGFDTAHGIPQLP